MALASPHLSGPCGRRHAPSAWAWAEVMVGEGWRAETGSFLLYGTAACLMWLRTLNFVLVQQDLGQVPDPALATDAGDWACCGD